MSILTINKSFIALELKFINDSMIVSMEDGRQISVPLEWFPKLRDASIDQLKNYRLIGGGEGIHWESLDEDLLVENLFI
jgi:hypothetical protein